MSLWEIAGTGAGALVLLLTLVQIAPVRLDPWTALARAVGKAINADVKKELGEIKAQLSAHVDMDDRRAADGHRARILHFNNELLRDIAHTKEEFVEVLAEIDAYDAYCHAHPDYPNNRAVLAIQNIQSNYMERLRRHDFLSEGADGT